MSATTLGSITPSPVYKKPRVKICGLTRLEDVRAAVDFGADYLGVILAGGPRMQSLQTVESLFGSESRLAGIVVPVLPTESFAAVLTDSVPTAITHLNQSIGIAAVQLHANPSVKEIEAARSAGAPEVWSVVHIDLQVAEAGSASFWSQIFEIASNSDAVVLDAKAPSGLGGSGLSFDWQALTTGFAGRYAELQQLTKVVLAGGLNTMNVQLGISLLAPDIVDVSSGVEEVGRPGIKDPIKIAEFIDTVKQIRDQKLATDNTVG